MMESGHLV